MLQYAYLLAKTDPPGTRGLRFESDARREAGSPDIDRAASEIAFFDADDLRARGIIDRNGYVHALTLDPQNQHAKDALASIDAERIARGMKLQRKGKRRSRLLLP